VIAGVYCRCTRHDPLHGGVPRLAVDPLCPEHGGAPCGCAVVAGGRSYPVPNCPCCAGTGVRQGAYRAGEG